MSTKSITLTYWHELATNTNPSTFLNLDERIEDIRKQYGICSFDLLDENKRTPLHVAVIKGSTAAVKFFLSRFANFEIRDKNGKIAQDYASNNLEIHLLFFSHFRLFLLHSDRDPYTLSISNPGKVRKLSESELSNFAKKILRPPLSIPKVAFTYRSGTDDFGRQIKQLYVCEPKFHFSDRHTTHYFMDPIDHIVKAIQEIGKAENFSIQLTSQSHFPRDYLIKTGKGVIKIHTSDLQKVDKALEKALSFMGYFGKSSSYITHAHSFFAVIGSSARGQHTTENDYTSLNTIPIYLEGGNCLRLTNSKGVTKVLIGEIHLYQILCQLRMEKYFDQHPLTINENLNEKEIRSGAEEMYALGLLELDNGTGKKSGFLSRDVLSNALNAVRYQQEIDSSTIRKHVIKEKIIQSFDSHKLNIEAARPLVAKYFSQKKKCKEYVAQILEIPPHDLHFISQWDYHLDTFIQSGPRGSLFVPDLGYSKEIVSYLEQYWSQYGLTAHDGLVLQRYVSQAKLLEKELGPLLQKVKNELQEADFFVIPSPACYYDVHMHEKNYTRHVRFLNAVTGWGNGHYYYISLGAKVGPSLGSIFMKIQEQFLKQYEPNLKVYFVGEDPQQKGDFEQAMALLNQVKNVSEKTKWRQGPNAGVHCLTFEMETQDHAI